MASDNIDTAKLDQLVQKLGDYVEANYNELVNPKHSTARSTLVIIFRAAAGGTPLLRKTAKELGIPVTGWHTTLDKIIEATEARGSKAADKIKAITVKTKALDKIYDDKKIESPIQQIKYAKRNPQG